MIIFGRVIDVVLWIAFAIFTAWWVYNEPKVFPLVLVVWCGGVLSVGLAHRIRVRRNPE